MTRILDAIHLMLKVVLGLLVAGLLVPISMQVLSRYTGLIPRYIWTEEIARFCFIWMIMIGAICAVRDGTHFDVDVLPRSPREKIEALKRIFVSATLFFVAGIFVWYGWQLLLFGWNQTSEIAELPMNWIYGAWPFTGILFAVFLIERIARDANVLRDGAP
jgi:TRAP-type C4-dicarboxylate transport system permease small subunit